jgi:hypothetical protein
MLVAPVEPTVLIEQFVRPWLNESLGWQDYPSVLWVADAAVFARRSTQRGNRADQRCSVIVMGNHTQAPIDYSSRQQKL